MSTRPYCLPETLVADRLRSIAKQFGDYKEHQNRYERNRTTRDAITLIVISITATLAFGSDWIFFKQLGEMREERRAWVGPVSASFQNGGPTINNIGKDAMIVLPFHNSGREPAIDLFIDVQPYVLSLDEDKRGVTAKHIQQYIKWCDSQTPTPGGQVVFPTTGASFYNLNITISGIDMSWDLLYGRELIVLTGCFVYITLNTPHKTSYCFAFQNGKIPPNALAFCGGNYAD